MNNSTMRLLLVIGLVLIVGLLAWWLFAGRGDGGAVEVTPDGGVGSPTECPQATPEFFTVEPVTSPTDQLTQDITVDLGNGETICLRGKGGRLLICCVESC